MYDILLEIFKVRDTSMEAIQLEKVGGLRM